jgi:hypothetical protein
VSLGVGHYKKCMDLETHKFIVSQDVVFDEVSSYYKAEGDIIGSTSGDTSVHNQPHTEISLPLSPNAPIIRFVTQGRTMHIEIEHHFIHEKMLKGSIEVLEVK